MFNFRGQNYYKQNMLTTILSGFIGLFAIIAIPDILKVLKFYIFVSVIYKTHIYNTFNIIIISLSFNIIMISFFFYQYFIIIRSLKKLLW